SANYTRSMFKQGQGISISDYIAKKRFDEVCRLLRETNMTAQEIGKNLGLNSGSYFYTSFKKHTGYTPEQYRKLHRNMNN
ncbi:MAG: AraC family transcriptional regulator, partial [Pseudomonadota bacterium]|nr:AraC family transcriptional regulator [Pseudomonadota bacterium]